jgi:hypothetical protein
LPPITTVSPSATVSSVAALVNSIAPDWSGEKYRIAGMMRSRIRRAPRSDASTSSALPTLSNRTSLRRSSAPRAAS